MVTFKRLIKHFMTPAWVARRTFPASAISAIEQAIHESEILHQGEVRFVAEAALEAMPLLRNQSPRERAIEVFSQLRVWDTENNNGVLIYLMLADRDVEIIADRGINQRVEASAWEAICTQMEAAFVRGDFTGGVVSGISAIAAHLTQHFPAQATNKNELENRPIIR